MGTEAPTPVVIPRHCAPMKAPCPKWGKLGRRKRKLPPRRVRTVAYKAVVFLEITCGEYQARCSCRTTFRNTPEDVLPRALYDNKVRDLVLDRILKDGMNVEQTLASLGRSSSSTSPRGTSMTCSTITPPNSTCPSIAVWSWNTSAARCASTICTWVTSRCCWPPIR